MKVDSKILSCHLMTPKQTCTFSFFLFLLSKYSFSPFFSHLFSSYFVHILESECVFVCLSVFVPKLDTKFYFVVAYEKRKRRNTEEDFYYTKIIISFPKHLLLNHQLKAN